MIHTYVLDFDSPCTANYGQSPITKAASFCFVVCVIPTKMMYNNQGRKQFGDDLNDDESQPPPPPPFSLLPQPLPSPLPQPPPSPPSSG